MDQYIGKMLDNRYEILERVGTGGMAVVYKARCHRLNRLVAVKILKPELASDADFRRRFHDESQAVAMLSHANIVSVYDVSHSDGLDYIVMELIDGMSLKQYMKKRGTPLNWREALHFITQIVRALGHAHSRGIIHRDIKPHNIMVLRDGSVKVADFGIARLASAAQATLTQEALGSVHYISPEQARGSHVDGRTDLYSTGVVLYEMLTGRLPFEGDTPVFVAIQHINSIPLAPRELNPDIPEALEAITMKAMAPQLENRYANAEEMLADLKEFRKNPGVPLPAPTAAKEKKEEQEEPTRVIPVVAVNNEKKNIGEPARKPEAKKSSVDSETKPIPSGEIARKKNDKPVKAQEKPKKSRDDDENDRPRRRRGVPPMLFAVLAIFIVIGAVGYFLYSFLIQSMFSKPEEYKVPNLLGYTIEELNATPALLGDFTIIEGRTVYSEEYKEGQICEQSPAAGEVMKEGRLTITVVISGGKDVLYMPEIYGDEARTAINMLKQMGLQVKPEQEYSNDVPAGYVSSYWPMSGVILDPGDEVTVWVSQGPEIKTFDVPNFVDMTFEQAKSQLDFLGLVLGECLEYYSNEYPAGDVIWQSLTAGDKAEEGTVINFQISKGPDPATQPTEDPFFPLPSDNVGGNATTQYISVNLAGYTGEIHVQITVGTSVIYDGTVNCDNTDIFERPVTGTGVQLVNIYINGFLVDSYSLVF